MNKLHIVTGQVCERQECDCCAYCETCDSKYLTDTGLIEPVFTCKNCIEEAGK